MNMDIKRVGIKNICPFSLVGKDAKFYQVIFDRTLIHEFLNLFKKAISMPDLKRMLFMLVTT